METQHDILLVYDKQCPACDFYCRRIDVHDSAGRLVRVDARDQTPIMAEISELGLDIDEGMVLKVGDRLYYGAEAINQLARLSSNKGFFNRFAAAIFRSPSVARAAYPILKACRNLLLKFLRRRRINNLQLPGKDRF